MLGNNADAFFTTPMRHTIVLGANVGNQSPMPIPRDPNSSATGKVLIQQEGNFLPLNDDTPPAAAAPTQNTILAAVMSPIGISVIAGVLLLTPMGKSIRRKVGLA